jgi:hypothetical protein
MRVVLVEVGQVRKMSDIDGLNIIRMHNDIERRKDLAQRLRSAGLTVDTDGEEWRTAGDFNRPALSARDLGTARQDAPPPEILGQDEAEYRVLCRIAEHFSQIGAHRLNTPFVVPGMTWDQIAVTLRDLADAKAAAIVGINVEELDYPAVITGLTKRGRGRLAAGR